MSHYCGHPNRIKSAVSREYPRGQLQAKQNSARMSASCSAVSQSQSASANSNRSLNAVSVRS
jgi:hypothetical protein